MKELVKLHIISRRKSGKIKITDVLKKIEYILGKPKIHNYNNNPGPVVLTRTSLVRGRCHFCIENIKGIGFKEKQKKVYLKHIQCQKCGKHICGDHSKLLCENF